MYHCHVGVEAQAPPVVCTDTMGAGDLRLAIGDDIPSAVVGLCDTTLVRFLAALLTVL